MGAFLYDSKAPCRRSKGYKASFGAEVISIHLFPIRYCIIPAILKLNIESQYCAIMVQSVIEYVRSTSWEYFFKGHGQYVPRGLLRCLSRIEELCHVLFLMVSSILACHKYFYFYSIFE